MKIPDVKDQYGFTLLEALVAMVLVSSVLMSVYSWINTDLISLRKAEAAIESQNIIQEAMVQLELLELSDGSGGEMELTPYTVVWTAKLVEPTMPGRMQQGGIGLYDLSLFRISFDILRGGYLVSNGAFRQYRYVKVRSLPDEPDQ